MDALGLRLGEAEADGVHGQRRDAEQLHGRADQAGRDHVVHKESTVVGEEHTPVGQQKFSGGECFLASVFRVFNTVNA